MSIDAAKAIEDIARIYRTWSQVGFRAHEDYLSEIGEVLIKHDPELVVDRHTKAIRAELNNIT